MLSACSANPSQEPNLRFRVKRHYAVFMSRAAPSALCFVPIYRPCSDRPTCHSARLAHGSCCPCDLSFPRAPTASRAPMSSRPRGYRLDRIFNIPLLRVVSMLLGEECEAMRLQAARTLRSKLAQAAPAPSRVAFCLAEPPARASPAPRLFFPCPLLSSGPLPNSLARSSPASILRVLPTSLARVQTSRRARRCNSRIDDPSLVCRRATGPLPLQRGGAGPVCVTTSWRVHTRASMCAYQTPIGRLCADSGTS